MQLPKTAAAFALTAACLVFSGTAKTAKADGFAMFTKTYKVQVEYWFFDTDYYYWSTVLETGSYGEAEFLYEALMTAKELGHLNEVAANSYWRYIAVDVRMVVEYNYPQFQPASTLYYQPLTKAKTNLRIK